MMITEAIDKHKRKIEQIDGLGQLFSLTGSSRGRSSLHKEMLVAVLAPVSEGGPLLKTR